MTIVTLSSKFQVSVPKDVRDALNLKAGQKLVFINTGTAIKLMAQPTMAELVGIGHGASTDEIRDRDDHRERRWPKAAKTSKPAARKPRAAKS
ncbi:MAG: AbrB/MazE/SpoVT family DNA-binding domain-containing protein [Ideonella sp.]|nr:AbrB/MazE/SpoVT family DNA-binding domain-containing protein [Ideonella sp.]